MQSGVARKMDYNGNIAYDLSRFDKRRRVREALEREPVAVPRPIARPREREMAEVKAKTRTGVSALTVLGAMVIALLMFFVVLNYMRLYEISMQVSAAKSEYTVLKSEAAVLQVKAEKQMSVRKIEEAALAMGMAYPEGDQLVYLNMSHPDRGEILIQSGGRSDFIRGIQSLLFAAIDFVK